jgi:hypothetical protein
MDFFEYILIITSVIYALAVAQILSGVSRLVQSQASIRLYLAHSVWLVNLFIYIFLIWWASWEFRSVDWTFPQYGYMLIAPTLLYFACSLLIPLAGVDEPVDLRAHFFSVRKPLMWSFMLASLVVVIDGNVLGDEPLWHNGRYGHLVILGVPVWGLFSSNRRLHNALSMLVLVAFAAIVVTRFWNPR